MKAHALNNGKPAKGAAKRTVKQSFIQAVTHLFAAAQGQTHSGGLTASKGTGIVGRNLSRAGGIGQVTGVVHGVAIGNVALGGGFDGLKRGDHLI